MSKPEFGPTGQFPEGKISNDDEGELVVGIGHDKTNDCIVIEFGTAVKWIALNRKAAMEFAEMIVKQVLASVPDDDPEELDQ